MSRKSKLREERKIYKRELFRRHEGICQYCRQRMTLEFKNKRIPYNNTATLDHIIAISRGGEDKINNLALVCYECNQKKGNQSVKKTRKKIRNG